jgi:beta-glucanase (GH16 family)
MKRIILLTILLKSIVTTGQTPTNDSHWQLLWEDNFNTFDSNKWLKIDWAYHGNEPQLYLAENANISNGNLVIKINNNSTYCPSDQPDVSGAAEPCSNKTYNYTSGWVEYKQAYNSQYGFIESRIKLPYGYGFWSAFWTFVGSGISPNNTNAGEIDIFEMLAWNVDDWDEELQNNSTIFTTNVWKYYPTQDPILYSQYPDLPSRGVISDYTQWHTYSIEWSPSKIIWYIDHFPVRVQDNHGIIDPVRIILNIALGDLPNSNTPFPSEMLIDYVKVYQLKEDCSNVINSYQYNFSNHENKLKNFIYLQGQNSLNTNDEVVLRASQFVHIEKDFTVPIGASLYVDVNDECGNEIPLKCSEKFNPCNYNFNDYDNSLKKEIELGGNNCNVTITPTNSELILQATDVITLKTGVTITSSAGKSVKLQITTCE